MERSTVERVAKLLGVRVVGTFLRHAAPGRDAFAGGLNGRWGEAFPVIYLGRPEPAVVVEAYRHLVDDTGVPASAVRRRILYEVRVDVANVLDLTAAEPLEQVGLADADLTTDIDDYERCQEVAAAAHQLKYRGILAPSATGLGETLALFRQRLSSAELPDVISQSFWDGLPADPRKLRVIPTRSGGQRHAQ